MYMYWKSRHTELRILISESGYNWKTLETWSLWLVRDCCIFSFEPLASNLYYCLVSTSQLSIFNYAVTKICHNAIILKICESNNSVYNIAFLLGIIHYQHYILYTFGLWVWSVHVFRWFVIRNSSLYYLFSYT